MVKDDIPINTYILYLLIKDIYDDDLMYLIDSVIIISWLTYYVLGIYKANSSMCFRCSSTYTRAGQRINPTPKQEP